MVAKTTAEVSDAIANLTTYVANLESMIRTNRMTIHDLQNSAEDNPHSGTFRQIEEIFADHNERIGKLSRRISNFQNTLEKTQALVDDLDLEREINDAIRRHLAHHPDLRL